MSEPLPNASGDLLTDPIDRALNIDRLYDYTKFHIGMYTTLVALILGYISFGEATGNLLLGITVGFFGLAGAFGGIICTNCLYLSDIPAVSLNEHAGVFAVKGKWVRLHQLTVLEHLSFWFGIASAFFYVFVTLQPADTDCRSPTTSQEIKNCITNEILTK